MTMPNNPAVPTEPMVDERDYTNEIASIALIAANSMSDNIGVDVETVALVIGSRIVDAFPNLELTTLSQPPDVGDIVPVAWRWRYYGQRSIDRWTVRQSPIEPFEPAPGLCGMEVEPLYAAATIRQLLADNAAKDARLEFLSTAYDAAEAEIAALLAKVDEAVANLGNRRFNYEDRVKVALSTLKAGGE